MEELREAVWYSMLDAAMNASYFGHLCRRYSCRYKAIQLLLALTASSAVAGWALWEHLPALWKILTGASSVLAIAGPILAFEKTAGKCTSLRSLYSAIHSDYQDLWLRLNGLTADSLRRQYMRIRDKESELCRIEGDIVRDRKLLLKCQNEVEAARGLG